MNNLTDTPLAAMRRTSDGDTKNNVEGLERYASLAGGGVLLAHGMRKGGLGGLLQMVLGGYALSRGVSGHCPLKHTLEPTPLEQHIMHEQRWSSARVLSRSITVNRPRQELYAFWRDLRNLPTFVELIERVDARDDHHAHWVARVPMTERTIEWDTYIAEDVPGEKIAWLSEPDAPVNSLGSVTFRDAPNGAGTEVHALVAHEVPGGKLGYASARVASNFTGFLATQDLRRFRQLMETGEIATAQVNRHPADKHTELAAVGEAR